MHYSITLLAAFVIFVSGCATTGSPDSSAPPVTNLVEATAAEVDQASAATDSADEESAEKVSSATTQQDWICRRERLTGSHYMVKICRPRYKIDEDMRRTQENMRAAQRSASNSGLVR